MTLTIRDARPDDAPFLAQCILSAMHFHDFEGAMSDWTAAIFERMVDSERRPDTLYTYAHTRVAEVDGELASALLSYPGEIYKDLRHKAFTEFWPNLAALDADSEQETDPGEYYLDSLAVVPKYRHSGIGQAMIQDSIQKGLALGYKQIALVADADMPQLIALYKSLGFTPADHRHAFGTDFLRMVYRVG